MTDLEMTTQPQNVELRKALVAVQKEIGAVGKDEHNRHGGFNFASREGIVAHAKPVLAKHGLAFSMRGPEVIGRDPAGEVIGARWAAVLTHESGQQESWPVEWCVHKGKRGAMSDEQKLGSAMSYANKNELLILFGIPRGGEELDSFKQEPEPPRETARQEPNPVDPERREMAEFWAWILSEETVQNHARKWIEDNGMKGKPKGAFSIDQIRAVKKYIEDQPF